MTPNVRWSLCVAIAFAPFIWPHVGQLAAQSRLARPIVVPVPNPSEYGARTDLFYRERDGRRFLMDVFTPLETPPGGSPGVIFIHGGPLPESVAAQGKQLGQYQSFGPFVTAGGLAGVVFSHGFSGLDAFQAARGDVEAAVGYVREHASELGIDPDRLCLVHVSAGGAFLAPFLASRPPWLKCVVLYYSLLRPGLMEELGAETVDEEQQATLDPFPFMTPPGATAPALLIAEAGRDAAAINADLRRLRDTAIAAGWRVEYWNHPDGPHGFDVSDPSERSRDILMRTRVFLGEQLRMPSGR